MTHHSDLCKQQRPAEYTGRRYMQKLRKSLASAFLRSVCGAAPKSRSVRELMSHTVNEDLIIFGIQEFVGTRKPQSVICECDTAAESLLCGERHRGVKDNSTTKWPRFFSRHGSHFGVDCVARCINIFKCRGQRSIRIRQAIEISEIARQSAKLFTVLIERAIDSVNVCVGFRLDAPSPVL